MLQLERGSAVDLGERREALGHAADDRERHREAERARPRRRGGVAADGDPDRERILERARVDAGAVERRAMAARPSVTCSASRSCSRSSSFSTKSSS